MWDIGDPIWTSSHVMIKLGASLWTISNVMIEVGVPIWTSSSVMINVSRSLDISIWTSSHCNDKDM